MNRPLVVIFAAVALDAVGIGLISPILPRLLEDVTHVQNIALFIGIMTALYHAVYIRASDAAAYRNGAACDRGREARRVLYHA
jgi:threonine/homoserine efflux transporter RhtA